MFDALYLDKPANGFSAGRRRLSDEELAAATPDAVSYTHLTLPTSDLV